MLGELPDLPDDLDLSVLEKRNFLLLLSPGNFDSISAVANMPLPTEEVQQMENIDVVSAWINFAAMGVMGEIAKASEWVVDFALADDGDHPEWLVQKIKDGYFSFSVSLLNHLLSKDMLHFHPQGEAGENILEFLRNKPSTFALPVIGIDDPDGDTDDN